MEDKQLTISEIGGLLAPEVEKAIEKVAPNTESGLEVVLKTLVRFLALALSLGLFSRRR